MCFLIAGALSQATGRSSVGLKELRLLKGVRIKALLVIEPSLYQPISGLSSVLHLKKAALATIVTGTSTTTVLRLAPTKTSSGDDECDHTVKDLEAKDASPPKKPAIEEGSATEQEIASLRSLVCSLQENERSLELQLLEYYGMQEQAAAVRDLERQLQMSSTEAKLYSLSIESLQSDNQRLEAQLADLPRVMNELESARATIRLLKKMSRSDAEHAAERTAPLHQRISQLQRQNNEETEGKMKRLAELEDEAAQLKLVNSSLTEQNSDLTRKLESAQASASSALEAQEVASSTCFLLLASYFHQSSYQSQETSSTPVAGRCIGESQLLEGSKREPGEGHRTAQNRKGRRRRRTGVPSMGQCLP